MTTSLKAAGGGDGKERSCLGPRGNDEKGKCTPRLSGRRPPRLFRFYLRRVRRCGTAKPPMRAEFAREKRKEGKIGGESRKPRLPQPFRRGGKARFGVLV